MSSSEEIFSDAAALPEITEAQLAEVRRRIAEVESGETQLIPGDEVLARVRNLLA